MKEQFLNLTGLTELVGYLKTSIANHKEILPYASNKLFPSVGDINTIYINTATNTIYRWDSSSKTYITLAKAVKSVAISESTEDGKITLTVDGNETTVPVHGLGSAAYTNSSAYSSAEHTHTKAQVGLGNVDNTADKDKSVKHATTADNATTAGSATTATNVSGENATGDTARHVWFSRSDSKTKRVYNDNFKYNPATNLLTTNITGSAASANSVAWTGVTGKPSTFTPSAHTHNYAGSSSAGGAANSANKLATARTVSGGTDITLSFNYDGSGNSSANIGFYSSSASVGDKNNYPFHRFAKLDTIAASYSDKSTTFFISQDYSSGGFGIVRIVLRTNNSSLASTVEVKWLVRCGLSADSVQVGIYNVFGKTYADAFFKTGGSYAGTCFRTLASGARGGISRTWVLVNSSEVSGTSATDAKTSTECYATIAAAGTALHKQAYSSIVSGTDSGTASYANSAGSANSVAWGNVTGKPSTFTPSAHKHDDSTITSLNASKLFGTIDIARLPHGALERCVIVTDDDARFKLTTADVQLGDTVKVDKTKTMYFVINESKLNSEEGYSVYTAGTATSVPWSGVTEKPSSYPPASHNHDERYYTETEMNSKLAEKATKVHTHTKSEVGLGNVDNTADATKSVKYATSAGSASSAAALTSNAGSSTQPVYFSGGKPVACSYTLGKSVPADALFTDHTYGNMKGATSSSAGSAGLVPAPNIGEQLKFLRADGTWVIPTNTTYSVGTTSYSGTTKLYTSTGSATDGTMTQNAITTALNGKSATGHTHNYAGSSSAGGNANAAVKLATARKIGSASFDGTADITLSQMGLNVPVEITKADYLAKKKAGTLNANTYYNVIDEYDSANVINDSSVTANSTFSSTKSEKTYAKKSTLVNTTLTASKWTGSSAPYSYVLSVSGVTSSNIVEIDYASNASSAAIEAYQNAMLADGGQTTNQITIKATEKPTVDIPITIVIRNDL